MTESEAREFMLIEKECINRDCNRDCTKCDIVQTVDNLNTAYDMAIKALEEMEKYQNYKNRFREIYGDCDNALEVMLNLLIKYELPELKGKADYKLRLLTDEDADKWDEYREIGTVEECRNAVGKMRPKEPWKARKNNLRSYDYEWKCPTCGHIVEDDDDTYFCRFCGQKVQE